MLRCWRYCVILALLGLSACGGSDEPLASFDPQVIYILSQDAPTFDPHIVQEPEVGIVLRQVYDTLVYRHPQTLEIVPGLATDWSVSEDGLTYTFRLRDGVTFHDGTRFDAVAVGVNLDRIMELDGYAASLLKDYRSYEIVDSRTIHIRLTEPFAPLLDVLSQFYFGMVSPFTVGEYSTVRYQYHQAGTGPFRLVDFIPGRYVRLERSVGYGWQPAFYSNVESQVESIEFRFDAELDERGNTIIGEEASIAADLSPFDARNLSVNNNVRVIPVAIPGQPTQFLFNTLNPPTDERLIRQALLYGTNRSEIGDTIFEGFSPLAWGPLSSNTLFYSREMNGIYAYDLLQARAAIESVGYEDSDEDGIYDLDGEPLRVTILAQSETFPAEIASLIQTQWGVVGVDVVLDLQPTRAALQRAIDVEEYHLVADSALGIDPHFLSDYYGSTGSRNWTGFQSETLDDLLVTAVQSSDVVTRAGAYVQAQRLIMNEALVLPIREVVYLNAVRSDVQNITFDAYGWYPLLNDVVVVSPQ